MKTYRVSKEMRKEICVHEAAHAVIAAISGLFVYRLRVVPEGWPLDKAWEITARKGCLVSDAHGVCEMSDNFLPFTFLKWIEDEETYQADRKSFGSAVRQLSQLGEAGKGSPSARELGAETRRRVRADICVLVAGPIGEAIFKGEEIYLEDWNPSPGHDLSKAHALSWLLPYRNEFETAASTTEEVLRIPEIWERVIRLAVELEAKGDLQECDRFLPERWRCWPRPPLRRANSLCQA